MKFAQEFIAAAEQEAKYFVFENNLDCLDKEETIDALTMYFMGPSVKTRGLQREDSND